MELELAVDRLAVGGDGIAREANGRVVFVRGGLPGEVVRARTTSTGKDFWRAETIDVLTASAARRAPTCPMVAAGCGGCGWQHVVPEAQLELKVSMVRDALARQGRLPGAEVRPGGAIPPVGYRTTVRLAVADDGRVGFRAASSHRVVPVPACEVAHPALSALIPEVRVEGATEVVLRLGVASGEVSAMALGPDGPSGRVLGLPPSVVTGPASAVHEEVAGHRFRVSAPSFFQSSPQSAELLVGAVNASAGATAGTAHTVIDLYGGVGLFAATVAPQAAVTLVEKAGSSTADARANLTGRDAVVVEADVDRWVPTAADLVVADPARSGLDRGGVAAVAGTSAPVVVLVSCDAAALGRDTRLLGEAGYRHAGSSVLDLFPGTPHVEVVTRFERS